MGCLPKTMSSTTTTGGVGLRLNGSSLTEVGEKVGLRLNGGCLLKAGLVGLEIGCPGCLTVLPLAPAAPLLIKLVSGIPAAA